MYAQFATLNRQLFRKLACLMLLGIESAVPLCAADAPPTNAIKSEVDGKLELQRRQKAEEELERLRERRHDVKSQLEYARNWARTYYGLDEQGIIRRPQQVSAVMQRHEKQKEQMKFALLEQRERFRGAIAKGTALNFFLQECGAMAFDHTFHRETAGAKDGTNELELKLLQGVSARYVLDENTTRHIRYQRGLSGNKLTGRLNEGPLDLEWPSVLRQDQFDGLCKLIEQRRDRIVAQLRKGQPVDAKSADALLEAVQDLVKRVRTEKLRQVSKSRGDYSSVQRYYAAEGFSKLLVAGSYRLIEARDVRDIQIEAFGNGNIEALMAFMYRNNLTFAEADANGESAYNMLFEMMTRYYVDLQSLRVAIRETMTEHERELAKLDAAEPGFLDISLGNSLSNVQQVEIARINAEKEVAIATAYAEGTHRRPRGTSELDSTTVNLAIGKILKAALFHVAKKGADRLPGLLADFGSGLAGLGRDYYVESALKEVFPELDKNEVSGIRLVISLYLDGKLSLKNLAKETAKEKIIEALKKENPTLGKSAQIVDFIWSLHQAKEGGN